VFRPEKIEYKTAEQVQLMRRAGLVVADAHAAVRAAIRPGATTADLDAVAARVIADAGAEPSFIGYHHGLYYPATLCVSVNEEIVHGIPGDRVLAAGDVVSVDCGAFIVGPDGKQWHGDSAFTAVIPDADPADVALSDVTEQAMWAGIAALATGEHLGAVGEAVEDVAAGAATTYGVVEEYTGHGIGTAMHQPPSVLNYRTRRNGPRLRTGMCLAVEPMLTRGSRTTETLADEWTVVTVDRSRAAHWEHTVAIGPDGIWVLTAHDGGAERLAALGVAIAPWEPALDRS
jgi:methionyl aminopeptidase